MCLQTRHCQQKVNKKKNFSSLNFTGNTCLKPETQSLETCLRAKTESLTFLRCRSVETRLRTYALVFVLHFILIYYDRFDVSYASDGLQCHLKCIININRVKLNGSNGVYQNFRCVCCTQQNIVKCGPLRLDGLPKRKKQKSLLSEFSYLVYCKLAVPGAVFNPTHHHVSKRYGCIIWFLKFRRT